jgi:hypothetical protein
VLKLGATAQRLGLIVGKPESHRHATMVSPLIPQVGASERPGIVYSEQPVGIDRFAYSAADFGGFRGECPA